MIYLNLLLIITAALKCCGKQIHPAKGYIKKLYTQYLAVFYPHLQVTYFTIPNPVQSGF